MPTVRDGVDFEQFYATYEAPLRRYAVRLVGANDADDLVQEAMLRASRHLDGDGFAGPPWSWLTTVTHNLAVDLYRRTRRVTPTDDAELLESLAAPVADLPSDEAVRADTRRRLHGALRRLSAGDRAALVEHEVDGASAASIAARLGMNAGAMRQRLLRARRSLAHHYQELGGSNLGLPPSGLLGTREAHSPWWARTAGRLARTRRWLPVQPSGNDRTAAVIAAVIGSASIFVAPTVPVPPSRPPGLLVPEPERPVVRALGSALAGRRPPVIPPLASARPRPAGNVAEPAIAGTLSWTERAARPAPAARYAAAMAYDESRHETVVFGGTDGASAFGDTWTWDGTAWTRHDPPQAPRGRHGASMVYDTLRRETILFGGFVPGVGRVNETWAWDGTTWAQRASTVAPLPRDRAALAFDHARGKAVLVGGLAAVGPADDTWTWDGVSWQPLDPVPKPSPQYGAALAYESATRQLVLFGGDDDGALGETWIWSGSVWHEAPLGAFPAAPRTEVALAYDRVTGSVLAVGGSYHADTWSWTGAEWLPVSASAAPPARSGGSMVFDTDRAEFVLFGGRRENGDVLGDTWTGSFRPMSPARLPADPADVTAPVSAFSTQHMAVIGPGGVAAGTVVDLQSGVDAVRVEYDLVTYELSARLPVFADATLDCVDDRTSCVWTAPAPDDAGVYRVSTWSTDRAGNRQQTGYISIVRTGRVPPG